MNIPKKKFIKSLSSALPFVSFLLPLFICFPLPVSLAALSASFLHEAGHLFAFLITRSGVPSLTGHSFGLILTPRKALPYKKEFIIALFGPLFNLIFAFLLLLISRPHLSYGEYALFFINLSFAAYNLLPVFFLDGGRMLLSLFSLFLPLFAAEKISSAISLITIAILLFFSLWLILFFDCGYGVFLSLFSLAALSVKKQR
jgi:stage IV sporulation protein FB